MTSKASNLFWLGEGNGGRGGGYNSYSNYEAFNILFFSSLSLWHLFCDFVSNTQNICLVNCGILLTVFRNIKIFTVQKPHSFPRQKILGMLGLLNKILKYTLDQCNIKGDV
jgi:hypothetical protein